MKEILLIDDDDQIRFWLRIVLEGAGYRVNDAANGNVGSALLRQYRPHLVITDLYMPGKEGIELVGELHRDFPDIKIIAISGGSTAVKPFNELIIANHIGAHKILGKPFSADELLSAVNELLAELNEPVQLMVKDESRHTAV